MGAAGLSRRPLACEAAASSRLRGPGTAVKAQAKAATLATARAASPGRSAAAERVREVVDRGVQDDDEHGREDQEHEWEEDLDRGLVRPLLGGGPSPRPHLGCQRSHDLAD